MRIPGCLWWDQVPYGVAVDAHGHGHVADTGGSRIEKFSQP